MLQDLDICNNKMHWMLQEKVNDPSHILPENYIVMPISQSMMCDTHMYKWRKRQSNTRPHDITTSVAAIILNERQNRRESENGNNRIDDIKPLVHGYMCIFIYL